MGSKSHTEQRLFLLVDRVKLQLYSNTLDNGTDGSLAPLASY